jgi:fumarylacetoacetate (FAA) hydrolase
LYVVSSDGKRGAPDDAVRTLQAALDVWERAAPRLAALARHLETEPGVALDPAQLGPPLPRAFEWVDGSAFLNHVRLVRKARGAEPPPTLETDPLVYQGGSGVLLGPRDDIRLDDVRWGCDFEAEVVVILGDVAQGTRAAAAEPTIRLITLANDVSLRNLIPDELAKGFGFFQSKPATAFAPFAVTPDELGKAWRGGRLHLPIVTELNNQRVGDPDAGEMHFSFLQLIEHIARTRDFTAGTLLGSGTVSNVDRARGISCLAERRMIELIDEGKATTRFLEPGDVVAIHARGGPFGEIRQRVVGGPA